MTIKTVTKSGGLCDGRVDRIGRIKESANEGWGVETCGDDNEKG